MANHYNNSIQVFQDYELYDPAQQLIEGVDDVAEVVEEEEDDDTDDGHDDTADGHDEEEEEQEEAEPEVESSASNASASTSSSQEAAIRRSSEHVGSDNSQGQGRNKGGEMLLLSNEIGGSQENGSAAEECNRSEIDGLFCPICMEAWTNGGDHQVCCLPCGHMYGVSCIKRWFQQHRSSGKCPQCNRKCTMKDVRVLYASRVVVVDEELQKKVRFLESKCASLEKKGADWSKKEVEWLKRKANFENQVLQLKERTSYLEGLLEDAQTRLSGSFTASGNCPGKAFLGCCSTKFSSQGCPGNFVLQKEFQVDGACFYDVDNSSQIIVIARRLCGLGGRHALTKMSLVEPHDREDIQLPLNTKVVKDLHISPHGKLALVASLGKKLSILSMETNNTILTYNLPAAAWSCSWDLNCSHYVYAGLQNGTLMEFDMRQTMRPVDSMTGLTCNPIHTVHSLSPDSTLCSGGRSLLTASSVGLCQWNFGGSGERSFLVPESENQGVCISLAYCPISNDIVASYRPKVEAYVDINVSQSIPSPATSFAGQIVQGSHVLYNKVGSCYQKLGSSYANVNSIRLPKSAIIDMGDGDLLFASGDETTGQLVMQDLPSFSVVQHLKPRKYPIRDVKCTHLFNKRLLGCLSDDILQLFSDPIS